MPTPISNPPGPFEPNWDSLVRYSVPDWYRDAKFGIFLHWGVYSVPAFGNEWYPRSMYQAGDPCFEHHVDTYGPQDQFGYKDFIPMFRAERFDPEAWADLFAESGARYVVPVAEHHDGFQMYRSALSRWNAAEMGPKRDVVGELGAAVRANGMVLGVSSHRAEHWWFMNGGRAFPSDVQDPAFADFYGPAQTECDPDEAFLEDWLARCCELVDQYRPQVFWFDWWIDRPVFKPYLRRFASYYYNRAHAWGVGVALNYKDTAYPPEAAVFDIERGQADRVLPHFWQTDTAVAKNSWSHVAGLEYKTSASIIQDLVDIVSKNGCLLLNIGPRADGTIPDEDARILREIGAWLRVCGEGVYGSRPFGVFGEGPTEVVSGSFKDTERAPFNGRDVRYTVKDGKLYAFLLAWPGDGIARLRSLGRAMRLWARPVERVELLGFEGTLAFERTEGALEVRLPEHAPPGPVFGLRID